MRLALVRLISPPTSLVGYLRRYMFQLETGVLLGSINAQILKELVATMELHTPRGFLVVSDSSSPTGYAIPYFSMKGTRLTSIDGLPFVERPYISDS